MRKPTVALICMVKDEEAVLQRMIDSVRPFIDKIIALDTGSTDRTIEILKANGAEVYEYPWEDFGRSRTRLMKLAKGKADWLLFLDADWTISWPESPEVVKAKLDPAVSCYVMLHGDDVPFWKPYLTRGDLDWRYVGACHEYLDRSANSPQLPGVLVHVPPCDPATRLSRHHRNLALLLAEYKQDPKNPRTVFYLANTYRDLCNWPLARLFYLQRAEMGDFAEEVFLSKMAAAHILLSDSRFGLLPNQKIDPNPDQVLLELWAAFAYRPTRAEPLFWLSRAYMKRDMIGNAIATNTLRLSIPQPDEVLWVYPGCYGPQPQALMPYPD